MGSAEKIVSKKAAGHGIDSHRTEDDQGECRIAGPGRCFIRGTEQKSFSRAIKNIEVIPITISIERLNEFQNHLLLFFTGLTRYASDIEDDKMKNIPANRTQMKRLGKMTDSAIDILDSEGDFDDIGRMLHESWLIKKSLSTQVSSGHIDAIYDAALKSGALGGKLLGAGGGGFILFYARPEQQKRLKKKLSRLLNVPFRFDSLGSQIIYYREGV